MREILKFNIKKVIFSIISLIVFTVVMTACSSEKTAVEEIITEKKAYNIKMEDGSIDEDGIVGDATILTIGKENVTYDEVRMYLLMAKQEYEGILGKSVWDFEVNEEQTLEEMVKDKIINQIIMLKITSKQAKKLDMSLTEDEQNSVEKDAKDYLSKITMSDQKKYGLTYDMVEDVFADNKLSEKLYDEDDSQFASIYSNWLSEIEIYVVMELWNKISLKSL